MGIEHEYQFLDRDNEKSLTGDPSLITSGFLNPPKNPMQLFKKWLEMAEKIDVIEPRGLTLATVDASGKPSSRVVLLKAIDNKGAIFGSSSISKKGIDLESTSVVAGTLWWRETMQQINFYGHVRKLSEEISCTLFKDRIRKAQAVAALSSQSSPMTKEKCLRAAITKLAQEPVEILKPKNWHAYHIIIENIEFWHGSRDRFHNRLQYYLNANNWRYRKLQP